MRKTRSIKVIDVYVPPNSSTQSDYLNVELFHVKTVCGKCEFNGTLAISVAPEEGTFIGELYTVDISSGKAFSASFTEAFNSIQVTVDNLSAVTGKAEVWLVTQD